MSRRRFLIRFLEFFVIGVGFGLGEDLIAIHFATDAEITMQTVYITLLVAFPFAVFTELVVDHPAFWKKLIPMKGTDKEKQEQ